MLPTILLSSAVVILGIEWALWRAFRRKMSGLHFPPEMTTPFFRFFSPERLRLWAIIHAITLSTVIIVFLLLLW